MPRVHFLNVRNGDCSIIQHISGHVSVIDVNCAFVPKKKLAYARLSANTEAKSWEPVSGNYGQKYEEDNPIEYLWKLGVSEIFRFIVSHPDMDHLGGVKDLFSEFKPINFWDTANNREREEGWYGSRIKLKEGWEFYKNLRDARTNKHSNPKRLVYYSGDVNQFYDDDGLIILAPTPELLESGNQRKNWNDASYVILYKTKGKKILFAGDSENKTWEHILKTWKENVSNLDILIAPHHGRHSGRKYDFMSVTKPKLTLYGNASSDHLAYSAWNNRSLPILTNNQAGYIILDIKSGGIDVFAKNETYARNLCEENGRETYYNTDLDAWYLGTV
jgi:competence protein ComEC